MSPGSPVDVLSTGSGAQAERSRPKGKIGVCHIASGDRWAGAEAQLATLLRVLAQREEFSLSAILLNEGRLAAEARRCGVEVKVIPEGQHSFIQIFSEAARFVEWRGVQVLHSHRYKENLLATLLSWRCHVPWVVRTQHGLPEPFGGMRHFKRALVQQFDRLVARFGTDRVISVTTELRDHLTRYVDERKVVVIHNGLDTGQVASALDVQEAKRRLGLPGDCWVVGTAGRLDPVKRLDVFLSAAKQISMRLPNSRFVIVGEGSEGIRLRELAKTNGLGSQIQFLGHRDDIYDVLRAFDVFVLCSDHEGLPMVLLEALYLGAPVVARSVGGIAEVVQNGVSGILVGSDEPDALAEACLGILGDKARRNRLGAAGTDLVSSRFSAKHTAAEVARLYATLYEEEIQKMIEFEPKRVMRT